MYSPSRFPDLGVCAVLGEIVHLRWVREDGSLGSLEFGQQIRGLSSQPKDEDDNEAVTRLIEDDRRVTKRITFAKRWRPLLHWDPRSKTLAVCPFENPRALESVPVKGRDSLSRAMDLGEKMRGASSRRSQICAADRLFQEWSGWRVASAHEVRRRAWPMRAWGPHYSTLYYSDKKAVRGRVWNHHLHHHDDYPSGRCEDVLSCSKHTRDGVPSAIVVRGPRLDVVSAGIIF